MAGAWNSNGTNFTDLNSDDANQRPYFEFLIVMSIAGIIWPIVSIIILFPFKQDMPPVVVSYMHRVEPPTHTKAVCVCGRFHSGKALKSNKALLFKALPFKRCPYYTH